MITCGRVKGGDFRNSLLTILLCLKRMKADRVVTKAIFDQVVCDAITEKMQELSFMLFVIRRRVDIRMFEWMRRYQWLGESHIGDWKNKCHSDANLRSLWSKFARPDYDMFGSLNKETKKLY